MNKELENWFFDNYINYENYGANKYKTALGIMQLLPYSNCIDVEENQMDLHLTYDISEDIIDQKIDYVIYKFGGKFYYNPITEISNVELKELKYIGDYTEYLPKNEESHVFAGVHGRYEVMSGTRDYKDWCKKAKFLQYKTLAICEKNTLAGTLPFQMACNKAGLNAIIGYSASVENTNGDVYQLKLFCINHSGWINLLEINTIINIDNEGVIDEADLLPLLKGLVAVIPPGMHSHRAVLSQYNKHADKAFFQITTNEYLSNQKDETVLISSKEYIDKDMDIINPILISDAYCLDLEDTHIKQVLNKQGSVKQEYATSNHYLRSFQELADEFANLFELKDMRYPQIWNQSVNSLAWINNQCKFNINTKELFLPKYEMTDKEVVKYGTPEKMFEMLIYEGLIKKFPDNVAQSDDIWKRIHMEQDVITRGGFIDYFLILWDIINWCKTQNIQVGPGRGSAAGCLISYLLGVVKINPLQFGLIFERFLNESRIKEEMPDIDLDFASDRRDEVIEYMRTRYGHDFVCRVGTYGTLQMRGVIKELARAYSYNGTYEMNFITHLIEDNEDWQFIFKNSLGNPVLKNFIVDNPEIVNDAKIVFNSIKSTSMHACATIIVPKIKDKDGNLLNIYQQIPVRKENGMVVSEWEGDIMADAGFLKEDILSTKQMAKIGHIFDLVKERTGIQLDMEKIPLDDPEVFNLFKQGYNQDVFHFGSTGLTSYLKQLKPDNIEELIAAIALYRPGAMASNSHTQYVKFKDKELRATYDFGLKDVTQDTYGLYIYQEQIMKAVQVLGGFTMTEADGVRKAMGKKIKSKMDSYRVQFLENAVQKGCDEKEAILIWDKLEVFSGYGFNKSHAAAYAVIGYYCNWLKHHHPLEFWTVAFQFADEKKILDYVGEIHRVGDIEIVAPDINNSQMEFKSDVEKNRIYWNLSSIKFVGEVASTDIIEERTKNGKFFSMEEFTERLGGKSVNKRVVEQLILAGCFDDMYKVVNPRERFKALEDYYTTTKHKMKEEFSDNKSVDYYWSIKQSEVSKLSNLDYDKLIAESMFAPFSDKTYITLEKLNSLKLGTDKSKTAIIAGMVEEIVVRKTKDKRSYCVITIQQHDDKAYIRAWPQQLELVEDDPRFFQLGQLIASNEKKLAIFRGKLAYNSYINGNELVMSDRLQGPMLQIF